MSTKPKNQSIIIATLQETIRVLTERNITLEDKLAYKEGLNEVNSTAEPDDGEPECVFLCECDASQSALHTIITAIALANGKPLDEFQLGVIFRLLIDNSMRSAACTANMARLGIDLTKLADLDPGAVNEFFKKHFPQGKSVAEHAKDKRPPEKPFSQN